MQTEADQSTCPACGGNVQTYPVLHHMICAYIGPVYDFAPQTDSYRCPKCLGTIISGSNACEIVGNSALCSRCYAEAVVSPPNLPAPG